MRGLLRAHTHPKSFLYGHRLNKYKRQLAETLAEEACFPIRITSKGQFI
jgi:hypothetical protein